MLRYSRGHRERPPPPGARVREDAGLYSPWWRPASSEALGGADEAEASEALGGAGEAEGGPPTVFIVTAVSCSTPPPDHYLLMHPSPPSLQIRCSGGLPLRHRSGVPASSLSATRRLADRRGSWTQAVGIGAEAKDNNKLAAEGQLLCSALAARRASRRQEISRAWWGPMKGIALVLRTLVPEVL
jgi:hypothetical protein